MYIRRRKRLKEAVSVISGEDGPTSIFIAGHRKKPGFVNHIRNLKYKRKREKIEKGIQEGSHSLEEVVLYIQNTYGAREMPQDSHSYMEEKKCLKESLILKHKPELLGDKADVKSPDSYDEESMKEFWKQIKERSKMVENIADEMMPMDLHLYYIKIPDTGELVITIDTVWAIFACSYSGKSMKQIAKDIYMYYGVTKEDIINRSERYLALVTVLAE